MKAYSEYQESNIYYLGTIPKHWKRLKLKYLLSLRSGTTPPEDRNVSEGMYKVFGANGVIGLSQSANLYKKSILIGRVGASGAINITDDECWVSDNALIVELFDDVIFQYANYLLSSLKLSEMAQKNAQPLITGGFIRNLDVTLPPLPEQQAIADFLNRKTAQIDTLIEKKQRQIGLLQEQRTALINHAVTKGLNPNVEMKDSGVEWLGEIPSHWNFAKVKYVCNVKGRIGFRGYTTDDQVSEGEGALTLGATHITSKGVIDLSSPVFISWEKYYESPEIMVNQNDILVVQRGSTCGKVGFIENEIGQATINPSLVILKECRINSKFLFYSLSSKFIEKQFSPLISKTAIPMLSQDQIGNFSILLPEDAEQKRIVEFLDKQQLEFDKGIDIVTRQINTLQEYRTALISEAVTGKVDVRKS